METLELLFGNHARKCFKWRAFCATLILTEPLARIEYTSLEAIEAETKTLKHHRLGICDYCI